MSQTIIRELCDLAGGQAEFGRSIGAAPALVYQWVTGRRPVSVRYVLAIETKYGVSRHRLLPDVFGSDPSAGDGADPDAGRIVPVEGA